MNLSDLTYWGIVKIDDQLWGEFSEWSNAGFTIVKGSKSSVIDKKLKFNHNQVRKYSPIKYPKYSIGNGHWDIHTDYDHYEHY